MDTQLYNKQDVVSSQSPQKAVLIVEDEKDYRDVVAERLEEEGYKIFKAENGQVAFDLLKNTNVDLILLDMLMPQMDGVTFFYHLRNTLGRNTPVIILTNFTKTAYPEGITDFVVKSNTSLEDVVQKIKNNIQVKI